MWAVTPSFCSRLWSPGTGNEGPFIVCARNSRPQKNIRYDYNHEDEDEEINRELENLKQQEIGDLGLDASASTSASAPNLEKISGSAVLLALQKASAQKTSKKMKKKTEMKNMNANNDNRGNRDAIVDYSDVKELCIKSDWKDRLDELEMQLHQLVHNP